MNKQIFKYLDEIFYVHVFVYPRLEQMQGTFVELKKRMTKYRSRYVIPRHQGHRSQISTSLNFHSQS